MRNPLSRAGEEAKPLGFNTSGLALVDLGTEIGALDGRVLRVSKTRIEPGGSSQAYPAPYVLLNRYVYGYRLIGGVVAGLSDINLPKFLILNAIAALVWASLFIGIGYVFGLGAEQVVGAELAKHERLLFGLGLGVIIAGAGLYAIHKFSVHLQTQAGS
jgi:hypothetical protein